MASSSVKSMENRLWERSYHQGLWCESDHIRMPSHCGPLFDLSPFDLLCSLNDGVRVFCTLRRVNIMARTAACLMIDDCDLTTFQQDMAEMRRLLALFILGSHSWCCECRYTTLARLSFPSIIGDAAPAISDQGEALITHARSRRLEILRWVSICRLTLKCTI